MADLFDIANYPTIEPSGFTAGDRLTWKRRYSDYPPAAFTLAYQARLEGDGMATMAFTATTNLNDYVVAVSQNITKGFTPGRYQWQSYLTRNSDSERITLDTGVFVVQPDFKTSVDDPASDARTGLAAITAVLRGRANNDQEAYTINGRSLNRTPIADLIMLKNHFIAEINKAERMKSGRSGKILTRFG